MATVRKLISIAGLLGLAIVHAAPKEEAGSRAPGSAKVSPSAKAAPVSGKMQVEEPNVAAPLNSARESKAWQKSHAHGLTEAQKQAFRDRKKKMESLIAVIKEKRKAMAAAKPEERAAIARELHSLMLEKDPGSTLNATARVASEKPVAGGDDKVTDEAAKENVAAESHRRQTEWRQQQARKEELLRIRQERIKSQQDNSANPAAAGHDGDQD